MWIINKIIIIKIKVDKPLPTMGFRAADTFILQQSAVVFIYIEGQKDGFEV